MPELLDFPENLVDVAGILADQPAFQEERVGLARPIAHLAVTGYALVGIDPDDAGPERDAREIGHAEVGYLQIARARVAADPVF
jgi:hypothetical protein